MCCRVVVITEQRHQFHQKTAVDLGPTARRPKWPRRRSDVDAAITGVCDPAVPPLPSWPDSFLRRARSRGQVWRGGGEIYSRYTSLCNARMVCAHHPQTKAFPVVRRAAVCLSPHLTSAISIGTTHPRA